VYIHVGREKERQSEGKGKFCSAQARPRSEHKSSPACLEVVGDSYRSFLWMDKLTGDTSKIRASVN
jgi:hypothetical protein